MKRSPVASNPNDNEQHEHPSKKQKMSCLSAQELADYLFKLTEESISSEIFTNKYTQALENHVLSPNSLAKLCDFVDSPELGKLPLLLFLPTVMKNIEDKKAGHIFQNLLEKYFNSDYFSITDFFGINPDFNLVSPTQDGFKLSPISLLAPVLVANVEDGLLCSDTYNNMMNKMILAINVSNKEAIKKQLHHLTKVLDFSSTQKEQELTLLMLSPLLSVLNYDVTHDSNGRFGDALINFSDNLKKESQNIYHLYNDQLLPEIKELIAYHHLSNVFSKSFHDVQKESLDKFMSIILMPLAKVMVRYYQPTTEDQNIAEEVAAEFHHRCKESLFKSMKSAFIYNLPYDVLSKMKQNKVTTVANCIEQALSHTFTVGDYMYQSHRKKLQEDVADLAKNLKEIKSLDKSFEAVIKKNLP